MAKKLAFDKHAAQGEIRDGTFIRCRQCGKEFRISPSRLGRTVYCTKACYSESQRGLSVVTCDYCGKRFERKPSQVALAKRHFCSRQCRAKGMRKRMIVHCEVCGKRLERIPAWQNDRHFCSKQCFGQTIAERQGHPKYRTGHYGGHYMRSSWEIKVAQWLDEHGIAWRYEPVAIPLGDSSYTPDFWLPELGVFWEVKGYMNERSIRKIARFRELYPRSVLVVLTGPALRIMGIDTG